MSQLGSSSDSEDDREMVPDIAEMPDLPQPTNWNARRMMERPRFRNYRGGDFPNRVWTPAAPSSRFAPVLIRAPQSGSAELLSPELPSQSGYISPGPGNNHDQSEEASPDNRRPVGLCTWLDLNIMEIRVSWLSSIILLFNWCIDMELIHVVFLRRTELPHLHENKVEWTKIYIEKKIGSNAMGF